MAPVVAQGERGAALVGDFLLQELERCLRGLEQRREDPPMSCVNSFGVGRSLLSINFIVIIISFVCSIL